LKDTARLVKQAQKGDKDSLVELVMDRGDQLYRIAYSYMGDEHRAMDMMQDTIVKAFHEVQALREPAYFYTWYIRILINCCKRALDRDKRIVFLDEYSESSMEEPSWREEWMDASAALKGLKEEFREVIIMRYMEDLALRDIARILDISEGTVKSRLHYGLRELKRRIDGKEVKSYGVHRG
jgi:RNA polymerase sigma-70 factor (ECF subfamily)